MDDHLNVTLDYQRGRFFGVMHILALKNITNALDSVLYCNEGNQIQSFELISLDLASPFWHHAIQAMLYDKHVSHNRPTVRSLLVSLLFPSTAQFDTRCIERAHCSGLMGCNTNGSTSFGSSIPWPQALFAVGARVESVRLMNQLDLAY